MKEKSFLLFLLMFLSLGISAQDITIGTTLPYGETMSFMMTPASTSDSVYVDWGNGNRKGYKLGTGRWDPKVLRVSGKLYGDTVRIEGSLKDLTIEDDSVTVLRVRNQKSLTMLNASNNLLTTEGLDLSGATALQKLTLSGNRINNINLSALTQLAYFTANDNPHLYTAVFADGSSSLKSISMNNCEVMHFYPYHLPQLTTISVENGNLQDIELGEYYPALTTLNLQGNKLLEKVDVTKQTALEKLWVGGTAITELNLSQNPELVDLNISKTNLQSIDLKDNANIQTLNVKLSKLKKLDISKQTNLHELYADSTDLSRIDLVGKRFIRQIKARNTKIEFLDLHSCMGYNRLNMLDIRDCKNMTPQTLNFTYQAMPYHDGITRKRDGNNVLLAGSNAEHSNTALIPADAANYYSVDVQGDGQAPMDSVTITRLKSEGGSYSLKQTTGVSDNLDENFVYHAITDKAKPGYPIQVEAVADSGYTYKGVEVNGKLYEDTLFVISDAASVKAVFEPIIKEDVIKLTVAPATPQLYMLASATDGSKVKVDWGNGSPVTYTLSATKTTAVSVDNTYGSTVTITGPVTYADFSSYPPIANDNKITGIDLSGNRHLQYLNLFTNELNSLDLSNEPDLIELNIGNCELGKLDVKVCPKLRVLKARSNALATLDLTNNAELTMADLVGNNLTQLDLSHNTKLQELNVASNKLTSIDLTGNASLQTLSVQSNKLSTLNLTSNIALKSLDASDNELNNLDLSHNSLLESFYAWGNHLAAPDLSSLTHLKTITVSNNAWDACTVNDFYYHLPECPEASSSVNLTIQGYSGSNVAENDAAHAESQLATGKGWTINKKGDGTGCDNSYVTVLPSNNGSVKLFDANQTEIASGTAVPKNTVITVQATPAQGYEVKTIKANGKALTDNKFTLTAATDVYAEFAIVTMVNGVEAGRVTVTGGSHEIVFATAKPVEVSVYSTEGKLMFKDTVDNGQAVSLPAGIYIVKVNHVAKKIIVK